MRTPSLSAPRSFAGILAALLAAALFTGIGQALTLQVTNTNDTGANSLRDVIAATPAGGTVPFAATLSGQTIVLGGTELLIDKNLTLDASALPKGLILSGNGASRVLHISSGVVTLDGLTISGGLQVGDGGGILNAGTLNLNRSTVTGNHATGGGSGGGIYNASGAILTTTNSTIANNSAANGGGIYSAGGSTLTQTTVTGNAGTSGGGGMSFISGTATLRNSLIAQNTAPSGPDIQRVSGTLSSVGANLIGDNSTVTAEFPAGPLHGTAAAPVNPLLGPLADNGGPTLTRAFQGNSPAVDAGVDTGSTPVTDQRGYSRVLGNGMDLGAVESGAVNFSAGGLALLARVPAAISGSGVQIQISADPNFLAVTSTLAGTGAIGVGDGPRLAATFSYPSGIAQDTLGNIFVADTGNNLIRMLSPAGEVSTIAGTGAYGFGDGPGAVAVFAFPSGIAVGPDNNVYVADTFNHRIRKLTRPAIAGLPWTVATLAGTGIAGFTEGAGTVARFSYPYGLVLDVSGNVYVADSYNHRVRMVTTGGAVSTYAGAGLPGFLDATTGTTPKLTAQFNVPYAVVLDRAGNLFVADRDNQRIRKVAAGAGGGVTTFAGSGNGGTAINDTGTSARFDNPVALAVDGNDNLYVTDQNNHMIRKVTPFGVVTTVAGTGTAGADNGNSTVARFNAPTGLMVALDGSLAVADTDNDLLRRIDIKPPTVTATAVPSGDNAYGNLFSAVVDVAALGLNPNTRYFFRWVALLDSSTQMLGQSFALIDLPAVQTTAADHLTPTSARLNATIDPRGNAANVSFLYSTDPAMGSPVLVPAGPVSGSGSVPVSVTIPQPAVAGQTDYFQVVVSNGRGTVMGEILSFTYPIPSVVTTAATDLTRTAARLNAMVDPKGSRTTVRFEYSTEPDLSAPYAVTTVAGAGTAGFVDAGTPSSARFNMPQGVAISGGIYFIADRLNHRIRRITPGGAVSTVAGGTAGYIDASPPATARFDHPAGVAADGSGNLYVADEYNHVIRKIVLATGAVSTYAGTGVAGFADGPSGTAQFLFPAGVAADGGGNVYVADSGNQRIRMIAPGGTVTTVAGSGATGFADGAAATAQFHSPRGVTVGSTGWVYVADTGNHRIRVIDGGSVTTLAGSGGEGFLDGPGAGALLASPCGVAVDGDGVVFVADRDNHRVRRVAADGQVSTLAGSGVAGWVDSPAVGLYPVTAARFNLPAGIAIDGTGRLLVTQTGNDAVRQIARVALPVLTVTPDSNGSGDRLVSGEIEPPLLAGATYYFRALGTNDVGTVQGDILSFTTFTEPRIAVFRGSGAPAVALSPGQTAPVDFGTTPLGTPVTRQLTLVDTGGWPLSIGAIHLPAGFSSAGGTGVVPAGSPRTFDVTLTAAVGGTFAGTLEIVSDDPDQPLFTFPLTGVVFDPPAVTTMPANPITMASTTLNATVNPMGSSTTVWFEVSNDPGLDGVQVTTVAGSASGFVDGTVAAAQFNQPSGLTTDAEGNIYVADTLNHRIRKITAGGTVATVAGTGVAGFADGPGATAQFNEPLGVVLGGDGTLFVSDSKNHRIRAISPGGEVTTYAGFGVAGFTEGVANGARFNSPSGLTIDAAGFLYVADRNNHRIRKVAADGSVSTLAGTGIAGFTNGAGNVAQFNGPLGVAVNAAGVVYVTEAAAHSIRKIQPDGMVSAFAGSPTTPGFHDGAGAVARFASPVGLAVDAGGEVVVADPGNQRIRKVTPGGMVSTRAGSGIQGAANGLGEVAQFDNPVAAAVNSVGELLVGERTFSTVRRIGTSNVVAQAATGLSGFGAVPVSALIAAPQPGKIYYFRVLASNGGGTTVGGILSYVAEPVMAVEQPAGANVAAGDSIDFGWWGPLARLAYPSLTFKIRNTGNTDLTGLTITIDGLNAGDFTVTSSPVAPVSAPDGSTNFTVRFAPSATGLRGATLHIASNDPVANPFDLKLVGIGTVKDPPLPFQSWQVAKFGGDAIRPLIAGPKADPGRNGVPNVMEYALGMDPHNPSLVGLPVVGLSGGLLTLTYTRVLAASDLVYAIEWSIDMKDWRTWNVSSQVLSNNGFTQQIRASVPVSTLDAAYIRLRVNLNQP
ncbi:MAG: choice-of-anchor D domain-containing protein [Verrucomicrobiota bacterium]